MHTQTYRFVTKILFPRKEKLFISLIIIIINILLIIIYILFNYNCTLFWNPGSFNPLVTPFRSGSPSDNGEQPVDQHRDRDRRRRGKIEFHLARASRGARGGRKEKEKEGNW